MTVSHMSAVIGDASDTLASGVISHVNGPAGALGLRAGQPLAEALRGLGRKKS